MKRVVNFRSFVYSAFLLMISILFCLVALNLPWLGAPLLILSVCLPVAIAMVYRKKIAEYKFITVIMTAALCLISVIVFFVTVYSFVPTEIKEGDYKVKGTIEASYYSGSERIVYLGKIRIDKTPVKGKMKVYIDGDESSSELSEEGTILSFYTHVDVNKLVDGFSVNSQYARSNERYYARVDANDIDISYGTTSFINSFNGKVRRLLNETMGVKYGPIAYGILTGDKHEIADIYRDSFSVAGIAHILAVSGLHIGFLMGVVTFILRKCKVKKLPAFITDCVILFIYCLVAGFSPSVVRASLMFLVGGGAILLGQRSDTFNSLGLATTAILTVSPIMFFDVGFIMSVGAVFGIAMFMPLLTNAFMAIKLPKKAAEAISITLSAQIGVIPPSICFFGSLHTYAILANIVLMPLLSFAFIFVFLSLIFALILPPLKILLILSAFPLKWLTVAADFIASLPLAQVNTSKSGAAFLIYPLSFAISGFFNCKYKAAVTGVCTALIILIIVICVAV